ncbi:sigma-54-dependent Fis family transcriptional regulator [Desulfuromonas acetoxidans]|uniref:sigma-54-dependent transcriptional regulator n=1 Tax=Desulfuromonas acetoxidans TaxID=891 RepID=UPI001592FD42|nr:sigma-54 dependent transcriptional regulator [Desulfuromonas acetoxidans]MBF0644683.1 sigma-54-dependent Fis family transcriptional regulator [Desulfuromonas acetoxidans]NVE15893.1 sigma-54-dependent Fis family transcriptional regulator [Desulfuromonas acetoxidans]
MKAKQRILVVDDEQSMREFLSIMLSREGYLVESAQDGESAYELLAKNVYDLILSDIRMPNLDGLSLLKRVKEQGTDTTVIMMTAFSTTEQAVEAMKQGAYDYLTKPFKNDEIRLVIRNALQHRQLREENTRLRQVLDCRYGFDQLIGKSRVMRELYRLIEKVAASSVNVLITGDSGTGKELVARSIHFNSSRCEAPFVAVNCGAIPENLLESELFGHEKGAFTGAVNTKLGLFEAAEGGTLFLDEVGELPQSMQVKLLRALQEKQVRRVGGTADIHTNVRIVAATNIALDEAVNRGEFRNDLYYRLNVIHLHLPALKERIEDIPLLIQSFCEKLAPKRHVTLSSELMQTLLDYSWPGNVRELENVIERCLILEEGDVLTVAGLPPQFGENFSRQHLSFQLPEEGLNLESYMESVEREILQQALDRCQGVRKRAAELLQVSFRSLRYRLDKLGL